MKVRMVALAMMLSGAFPAASCAGSPSRSEPPRQPVVVKVSDGGFRWADAAVGVAGASGVAVALVGLSMFRTQLRKEEG